MPHFNSTPYVAIWIEKLELNWRSFFTLRKTIWRDGKSIGLAHDASTFKITFSTPHPRNLNTVPDSLYRKLPWVFLVIAEQKVTLIL